MKDQIENYLSQHERVRRYGVTYNTLNDNYTVWVEGMYYYCKIFEVKTLDELRPLMNEVEWLKNV